MTLMKRSQRGVVGHDEHLAERAQPPRDVCIWRQPPSYVGNGLSDGSAPFEGDYKLKTHRALFNVNEMRWKHWGLLVHISMGPKHTKEMNEHEARAGSLLKSVIYFHGDKKRRRTKNWHLSGPKINTLSQHYPYILQPPPTPASPLHPTLHCSMHVLTEYEPGSYF